MVADWGQENIKEYSIENDKYYSLNKSYCNAGWEKGHLHKRLYYNEVLLD